MKREWSEALVAEELTAISLSLGHFPSSNELRGMGRNPLSCAACKRGGLIHWSQKIGFERLDSDSDHGWRGEAAVADILRRAGYTVRLREYLNSPYDLIANGVTCDVKTASYAVYGYCRGWFYRIGKRPNCDLILLYREDRGDIVFLPANVVPTTNLTFTEGGKYKHYLGNWDVLLELATLP